MIQFVEGRFPRFSFCNRLIMSDIRPDLTALVSHPAILNSAKRRATWLLPVGVLLGFALVFLLLFRDRLIPARSVIVVPAVALESKPAAVEKPAKPAPSAPVVGRLLFQASGWVEPDPLPIKVSALTDGFIDQVHVLEGAIVKKGELIATLVEIDARLAKETAAAEVEMLEADLTALSTGTDATRFKLDADRAELASSEADAAEAVDRLDRFERMGPGAVPETERITARFEKSRSAAAVLAMQARIKGTEVELARITSKIAAMKASVAVAKTKLAQATLAHERTRIVAPLDGRVLRLLAVPGQKKGVDMDEVDSSTVAILYDPAKLQVRVDVPLADAAGLSVGQQVKIRCNLLPDEVFNGEVTRISGEADLQRNTLQAKVRIANPVAKLRPEMLCRAEFLDTATTASPAGELASGAGNLAVFVPESAMADGAVWVCDPDSSRVNRRAVVATDETREGFRRLESGIRPGEWIVKDPAGLREGQRVHPNINL
jgi:multidrug resistance efflux pump